MNTFLHIIYRFVLLCCFLGFFLLQKPEMLPVFISRPIPLQKQEAGSRRQTSGNRYSNLIRYSAAGSNAQKTQQYCRYLNIITDQQQRDSLFKKLARTNAPIPVSDSAMWKNREHAFDVYGGKQIRYVYYNQLKVFGTTIEDTTVVASKLIRFANKLHYDTRTWAIKQALFFREGDTVNAYKLVDNERYLRRLPFIQDARIYVINSYESSDSIDIVVLTKDVFEYGGAISSFNGTKAAANIFNTNLLGAAQRVTVGFSWDNSLYTAMAHGRQLYEI